MEKEKECKDHLGNTYASMEAMAKAYGLDLKKLHIDIRRGWSLKDALTTPKNSRLKGKK